MLVLAAQPKTANQLPSQEKLVYLRKILIVQLRKFSSNVFVLFGFVFFFFVSYLYARFVRISVFFPFLSFPLSRLPLPSLNRCFYLFACCCCCCCCFLLQFTSTSVAFPPSIRSIVLYTNTQAIVLKLIENVCASAAYG